MKNALTPFKPQVREICERLLAAATKSVITSQQFQMALAYPGTGLEDGLLAVFEQYAKKVSGLITPVRAQDTGLVPDGWTVKSDNLEGDISLANLDYSSCPVREGKDWVNGDVMLERAGNAYGSLGFAAALLKAQDEGKAIFPVESCGKHYFIMPRTILLVGRGGRFVVYFGWDGWRWVLNFRCLDYGFYSNARFVRPRD